MGDFKINGYTPTNIQLNGADVQKIYNGSELVWPPVGPGPCTGYEFADKAGLQIAVNLWISDEPAAVLAYGQINTWCTGNVTDMSFLFQNKITFNDDISNWDVSNVTNMESMFEGTRAFNQGLNSWDVSNVTNMRQMFFGTWVFDTNISFKDGRFFKASFKCI